MKTCNSCKVEKIIEEFYKDKRAKDGLYSSCKKCSIKSVGKYRKSNNSKVAQYRKEYRKNNAEKISKGAKQYRESHFTEIARYRKTEKSKEAHRRGTRKYQKKFPEKHRAHARVHKEIERGKLLRPTICPSCNTETFIEAHHKDYSQPLDVDWRCTKCHKELR